MINFIFKTELGRRLLLLHLSAFAFLPLDSYLSAIESGLSNPVHYMEGTLSGPLPYFGLPVVFVYAAPTDIVSVLLVGWFGFIFLANPKPQRVPGIRSMLLRVLTNPLAPILFTALYATFRQFEPYVNCTFVCQPFVNWPILVMMCVMSLLLLVMDSLIRLFSKDARIAASSSQASTARSGKTAFSHRMVRKVGLILGSIPAICFISLCLLGTLGQVSSTDHSGVLGALVTYLVTLLLFVGGFSIFICLIPALLLMIVDVVWSISKRVRASRLGIVRPKVVRSKMQKTALVFKVAALIFFAMPLVAPVIQVVLHTHYFGWFYLAYLVYPGIACAITYGILRSLSRKTSNA